MQTPVSDRFAIDELVRLRDRFQDGWFPFFDIASMSLGIYELPTGATDPQTPHDEDEIYFVVSGRGKLVVEETGGTREWDATPGAILFVKARAVHRFDRITESLRLLVFFSKVK